MPSLDNLIRVLIVDDIDDTRKHLAKLLSFESDMEVAGEAASGEEAMDLAVRLKPDVVLMDVNMPGMDGIMTTERMSGRVPEAAIVMMSVQSESDYLRRSMLAGAREFLVKPFSSDELTASIRQVYAREREKLSRLTRPAAQIKSSVQEEREPGKIVAFVSPKGGVGRTTIAVNTAVAAASLGKEVCIVDASLQFGDVGALLNLNPKNRSISGLANDIAEGQSVSLESYLVTHSAGIHVLLAPADPTEFDMVNPAEFDQIMQGLRNTHDLVIVDCGTWIDANVLSVLNMADVIMAVMTLEITSIKNIRLLLELLSQKNYPPEQVKILVNRSDAALGIRIDHVVKSIGRRVDYTVVSDGRAVVQALNRGVPIFVADPTLPVSQDMLRIATSLVSDDFTPSVADKKTRRFGR
jgi:pilus assembly protein CpaE